MTLSSGPPSRGPKSILECNPAGEASSSPRVLRARTLSDVSGTSKHDRRRLDLDREMVWREQPLDAWFQNYLPGADPTGVTFAPFEVELANQEQGMYAGLRDGLNSCLRAVGWDGYEALTTDRLPDSSASGSSGDALRPDMGIYPIARARTGPSDDSLDARVAWAWLELLIEVKWDPKAAPFSSRYTPRSAFLPTGRERCLSRGQLAEYAVEQLNRQHRQFLFMVHVMRDCARILRFDRSGAVVSEEFDYVAHPEVIGTLLFRLSRMSRAEQGHDPTATLASEREASMFKELHARFHADSATARGLRNAVVEGWPIVKITMDVPFSSDGAPVRRGTPPTRREFLVGKPASLSLSLVGPGAKGFVAYDLTTNAVVFMKDSWRLDSRDVQSEYETYLQLREKTTGELYVPTLLGGGDVSFDGSLQRTASRDDAPSLVHCRLVFKEICRPLEDFTNSFELVKAVTWALVAHSKAWKQCGILHRDISVKSIVIYDSDDLGTPTSIGTLQNRGTPGPVETLADWDVGWWPREGIGRDVARIDRSDSWPFMSARLQEHRYPGRQHDLADDLESFMHVLNYCALKHLPGAASTEAESAYLTQCLYDAVVPTDSPHPKGSPLKLEKVKNGMPFVNSLPAQHPLAGLLAELSQLCKQHYERVVLPESPPRSPSPEETFAEGSCDGSQGALPDYDGDLLDSPDSDELDGWPTQTCAPPSPHVNIALSPLRSHDRMVGACMKAIRKVWPAVDRRDRPIPTRTRPRPLVRTGSRVGAKRTWSESDCSELDGAGENMKPKRVRRGSESSVVLSLSGTQNAGGIPRRRSSK
ncbi:hypothetical protein GSI_05811 [Ganoderma sinense ZZ0214-1]|uniref:Fungal-type protein kinase domain-containing protein n=1 Tax=Ganoderma sinense ZZ0214-1 TaxID=1077348 RepID=A0A2G8SBG8_9APHY|nr:hypothetical protein GSI_05811 [Ganoderma sinense ZZ0214-1]